MSCATISFPKSSISHLWILVHKFSSLLSFHSTEIIFFVSSGGERCAASCLLITLACTSTLVEACPKIQLCYGVKNRQVSTGIITVSIQHMTFLEVRLHVLHHHCCYLTERLALGNCNVPSGVWNKVQDHATHNHTIHTASYRSGVFYWVWTV